MKFLFSCHHPCCIQTKEPQYFATLYNYNYLTATSLLALLCTTFLLLGLLNDRLFSFLELFLESFLVRPLEPLLEPSGYLFDDIRLISSEPALVAVFHFHLHVLSSVVRLFLFVLVRQAFFNFF